MIVYKDSNRPQSEQTATPDKYPQKIFHEKKCRVCGGLFNPMAPSHLYCSQECVDYAHTDKYLLRTYGIGVDDYQKLHYQQSGLCAICGGAGFLMDEKRHRVKLVVDHEHASGQVRGLLCHNCNRALGLLKDNTEILKAAIQYLKVQRLSLME